MHWKQPLGGVSFWKCFGAYAVNLQGAPILKSDFNKDALLREVFPCQFAACFWGTLSWDGL